MADGHGDSRGDDKLLFFASDGLRQDVVAKYADQGVVPGFRDLLRHGAFASGNGLLTQAPPNTGAGWFTLSTGAWPGVHGSTNNTFHINGGAVRQLHVGVRPGQRPPGRDARPGGRARRQEGRADRVGRRSQRRDPGPDARLPQLPLRARRGDELHLARRHPVEHHRVRRAVRQAGFAGPGRPAGPAVPQSFSPAKEMHMAVRDTLAASGIDKYGLNAYIYDCRNDGKTRYDRVLFSRTKSGERRRRQPQGRRAGGRQGHDRHDDRRARRQDRRDARQGRAPRVSDLSQVRLFHTSVTRAIATLADVDRRAGLHRQLRGLRGRALPVLAGR